MADAGSGSGLKIRVLVIEDSAYNRRVIREILESDGDVEVVGQAADGEAGLQQAFSLQPDVICLDLEMPRMDGFTFLRILMSKQPTPVIVVSSQAEKQNVFRALEFGALDFVAKPSASISPRIREIKNDLLERVRLVRSLRLAQLAERAEARANRGWETGAIPVLRGLDPDVVQPIQVPLDEMRVVAIGASTGGPPAVQRILQAVEPGFPGAVVVTQHMPERFTKSFAGRLNRLVSHLVTEAEEGHILSAGHVYIAPGNASMGIVREDDDAVVRLSTEPRRYIPSIDHMFESTVQVFGTRMMAVVLTGMGVDGTRGIRAARAGGARTVSESAETAVISGMPDSAIATGDVEKVLDLGDVGELVRRFLRDGTFS